MMKSNASKLFFNSMPYKGSFSLKSEVFRAVKSSIFIPNFNLPKFWKKLKF